METVTVCSPGDAARLDSGLIVLIVAAQSVI